MGWIINRKKKQSKIPIKGLREYSNKELKDFLDRNEEIDLSLLGAISSEVLRRRINNELSGHPEGGSDE